MYWPGSSARGAPPSCRREIERGDLGALGHLARTRRRARRASRRVRGPVSRRSFRADQDIGQLPVGRGPGRNHFVGGDLGAQHLADGAQQAGADDRVMRRLDLQRDMLVDDLRDQSAEGSSRSIFFAYISTLLASARGWSPLAWCAWLKKGRTSG